MMPASFIQKPKQKRKGGADMFTEKKEQILNTCCRMLISRACKMAGASACMCLRPE